MLALFATSSRHPSPAVLSASAVMPLYAAFAKGKCFHASTATVLVRSAFHPMNRRNVVSTRFGNRNKTGPERVRRGCSELELLQHLTNLLIRFKEPSWSERKIWSGHVRCSRPPWASPNPGSPAPKRGHLVSDVGPEGPSQDPLEKRSDLTVRLTYTTTPFSSAQHAFRYVHGATSPKKSKTKWLFFRN